MHVVFLHGPVASGKHTIGRMLADASGLPLFHNHLTVDLVGALFDFGTPEFIRLREHIWLECFREAARAGRSFIFTFAPEGTVSPGFVEQVIAEVRSAGGEIHFVELICPLSEVEARLTNPSREAFGKLTSLDLYRELSASGAFDYPPLPAPLLRIDTALSSPPESTALVLAALERQRD